MPTATASEKRGMMLGLRPAAAEDAVAVAAAAEEDSVEAAPAVEVVAAARAAAAKSPSSSRRLRSKSRSRSFISTRCRFSSVSTPDRISFSSMSSRFRFFSCSLPASAALVRRRGACSLPSPSPLGECDPTEWPSKALPCCDWPAELMDTSSSLSKPKTGSLSSDEVMYTSMIFRMRSFSRSSPNLDIFIDSSSASNVRIFARR